MKRVLYVTNLPALYKVMFFELLSRDIDLTVVYERKKASDRDDKWKSDIRRSYKEIYLRGKEAGNEWSFSTDIIEIFKRSRYDIVLMNGYSSPTAMITIVYMKIFYIKYAIVCDGMLPMLDNRIKNG